MTEPTKILPFVRAVVVAKIGDKFGGYPRFAREFQGGAPSLRPVLGFALPGGPLDGLGRR